MDSLCCIIQSYNILPIPRVDISSRLLQRCLHLQLSIKQLIHTFLMVLLCQFTPAKLHLSIGFGILIALILDISGQFCFI